MTDGPRAVDALADHYVEDYAALDPIAATYFGIPGHDDELPDLTPDGLRRPRGGWPRRARRDAGDRCQSTSASAVAGTRSSSG